MDRFRFRVWYTKDKEYLDPNYYEGCCLLPDGNPHVGMTIYNGICDEYQVIPPKQLIVEQCTGLRDMNNKLIFEGDVVKVDDITGTVVFKNGCFVWNWKFNGPPIYNLDNLELEIIGNIHEVEVKE